MLASNVRRHLCRPLLAHRHNVCHQIQTRRALFGMGEILSVLANPAETLRQLNESRDMLKKAKEDMELSNEAKKIPTKHTFAKLPGFHGREVEQNILRKIFSNQPKMTTIFGATSVGKTALLREVLATDDFYTIKFDLRISGFANLRTLYVALCEQFERFFEEMHDEEMNKNKLLFKHLVLDLEEKEKPDNGGYAVTVADLASLMESLQSCLLRYWDYNPSNEDTEDSESVLAETREKKARSSRQVDVANSSDSKLNRPKEDSRQSDADGGESEEKGIFQKRPVVFLMDEAHKLPALVDDQLSLKVFLDTLLVLTKQDRLCHVVFATSDAFFHHFLRAMNVGHHSQFMTIGDCTKEDTKSFFDDEILPSLPDTLKKKLTFEEVYEAFGGKLAHINDYASSWVNNDGNMSVYQSAIFVQAYTLLQFHLTRAEFETFSPLSVATAGARPEDDAAKFTPEDLVYVMKKMTERPYSLPYFDLCHEIGTAQVDSMIKTRILELRWTKSVAPEDTAAEVEWSSDGIERPVVMPMTRMIRRAMEVVLKEEAQRTSKDTRSKAQASE